MLAKNVITIKYILWLLLVWLCCQSLHAQSYTVNIHKLSVEDGLSNRFVRAIYKDGRGFMWIGTHYGLNRYDGYSFKHYTTDNSNLSSNIVREIYEDDNRELWIRLGEGSDINDNIAILDLQTDSIQSFSTVFKGSAPFSSKEVSQLYSNARKGLWIKTKNRDVYRYRDKRFELIFSIPEKLRGPLIHADGRFFWLIKSAHSYDEKILKVNLQSEVTDEIDFPDSTRVRVIGFDKNQSLWLFQRGQKRLLKIDKNNALHLLHIKVVSAYRSFYRQKSIWERKYKRSLPILPFPELRGITGEPTSTL